MAQTCPRPAPGECVFPKGIGPKSANKHFTVVQGDGTLMGKLEPSLTCQGRFNPCVN